MVLETIYFNWAITDRNVYVGHISCTIGSKNRYFVDDLSYIIPTKNQFIVRPGSRGEMLFFLIFRQSEIRIDHGNHVFVQTE